MIIFKDLIHYCQVGRGISTGGHLIVVCIAKTLKQKTTRIDTEDTSPAAACLEEMGGAGAEPNLVQVQSYCVH